MNKKEYFSSISTYNTNIRRYRELARRLREAATDTSVHYREIDVQKSPNYHPMATLVEQAIYYDQKADELSGEREVVLSKVTKSIAGLDDPVLEEVLTLRYISPCLPMAQIGEMLHLSRSQVYQLHDKALGLVELDI